MTSPEAKPLQDAIAVMTAWTDNDDSIDFAAQTVVSMVQESEDEFARLLSLATGLLNLCGILLVRRETEQGIDSRGTLQEIAHRYADM